MSSYDYTMERVRYLVMNTYNSLPQEVDTAARQFFKAMDGDGNGSIDFLEFKNFLISEGYEEFSDRDLFKKLDRDGSRGLDFWEVMSLYYIIKSGRPFCSGCDDFLMDTYSVCNTCAKGPYYFCFNCSKQHNLKMGVHHSHPYNQPPVPSLQRSQTTSNALVPLTPSPSMYRSSSVGGSISPLRVAFKTLELTIAAANVAVGVGACSIM